MKYGPVVTKPLKTTDEEKTKYGILKTILAWDLVAADSLNRQSLAQLVKDFDREFADLAGAGAAWTCSWVLARGIARLMSPEHHVAPSRHS